VLFEKDHNSAAADSISFIPTPPFPALGFPCTLPRQLWGGFVIADIDNDGYVEVVFGTQDNYLHIWELGECVRGYSPWPQCQHDAARTGVLLEE